MDFWQAITIIGLMVGLISGLVAVVGFFVDVSKLQHKYKILVISLPLAVIFLASAAATSIYRSTSSVVPPPTSPTPAPTSPSTSTLAAQPTVQPTTTPTASPTVQPTSTTPTASPTPGVATAGPSGSIRLKCACSDPVLVTITKIDIQPQQNRMLWSLTLQNVSPNNAIITFRQFYLQQGNLISDPTSGGQEYPATGGAANNTVSLQPSGHPGAIQTTTLTFLFLPYATSYTLTSILDPCPAVCDLVSFDPAVIPFR